MMGGKRMKGLSNRRMMREKGRKGIANREMGGKGIGIKQRISEN